MYGVPGVPLITQGGGDPALTMPLEQPKNLFRYGEQSIWSCLRYAGGAAIASTTNRLFTTQQGQVGGGFVGPFSIAETNLKEPGRIPAGVAYDVFGVSSHIMFGTNGTDTGTLSLSASSAANLTTVVGTTVNLLNNLVLSWDFTQTTVDIAPMHLIGAGGGPFGSLATADTGTPATGGMVSNGAGSIWLYRKNPVNLPGQTTFGILLRAGTRAAAAPANNDVVVKVALLGYYKNIIEIG